jgi:Flp pilus assembly protein TadD
MPTPFLSSEEYDERAHQLYNEGRYEDALRVLREGLSMYPAATGLHVGTGYAHLARGDVAWARRSFETALALDSEHDDATAGLGETLLKLGRTEEARRQFYRTLELGFEDDAELMMQIGRALFHEGLVEDAKTFFDIVVQAQPDHADALAMLGYSQHRLDDEASALTTLRKVLRIDPECAEARIYLANVLYDRGEKEAALYHLSRTGPDDHWDELGIWRYMELKRSIHGVEEGDTDFARWEARLAELASHTDSIDELLAEVEARVLEQEESTTRSQLELFGSLLVELSGAGASAQPAVHSVVLRDGRSFEGTWEDILRQMKEGDRTFSSASLQDYMANEARRGFTLSGVVIPIADAESFIKGSADAGLLRILG